MRRAVTLVLLLLVPAFSGCIQDVQDGWDRLIGPRADVQYTLMSEENWNRDGHFGLIIIHNSALSGGIELTSLLDETTLAFAAAETESKTLADGRFRTELDAIIPDGTWDIRVVVHERTWARYANVRIDSVAPTITGLETGGHAPNGDYLLGSGARISDGTIQVLDEDRQVIGTELPITITGLEDGVHVVQVVVTDQAGNRATQLVQILAGKATDLPRGDATFGIVSRYTIEAELWDLARAGDYLMPAEARLEAPEYLGSGHGVTPDDPAVQAVVADVVRPGMTTMEVAFELYEWMFDELEYDEERLVSQTLMLPRHVILDTEDPDGEAGDKQDAGADGLSDDGPGNGVKGGVCRDLAGTYVSLLRSAGVPARLVTGYLAGTVDGFHAWVEVYVGELAGHPAWMPVDVSPVDGRWDDNFGISNRGPAIAMQAFGIRLPDYLPLRTLQADEEIQGWSTAIRAGYSYPADQDAPDLEFLKKTVDNFKEYGVMCVDTVTYARQFAADPDSCTMGNAVYGWQDNEATFSLASVQVIDYGVLVDNANEGTSVSMEVSYPFTDELAPVLVEYEAYGPSYHKTSDGYLKATLEY